MFKAMVTAGDPDAVVEQVAALLATGLDGLVFNMPDADDLETVTLGREDLDRRLRLRRSARDAEAVGRVDAGRRRLMHVTVDLTSAPPAVALAEPDDCTRFDVVVQRRRSTTAISIGRWWRRRWVGPWAMTPSSRWPPSGGWLPVRWARAGRRDFAAMLDYARSRGWLTDDGQAIRAHVEWR